MTVITRQKQLPVILPFPPKGFAPMKRAVQQTILVATSALWDLRCATVVAKNIVQCQNDAQKSVLVWDLASSQQWAKFDCRTLFLDAEMTEALRRTRARVTSGTLRGEDIRFRYPAFMVWWPPNTWRHPTDDMEVGHSIVSCYDEGEIPTALLAGPDGQKQIQVCWRNATRGLCYNHYWTKREVSSGSIEMSGDLASCFERFSNNNIEPPYAIEFSDSTLNVVREISETIVNLLLLMASYPQYLHPITVKAWSGRRNRTIVKKTAYIVARTMDVTKTIAPHKARLQGDPAYHVRPHEREAHWRRQRHGDRFEIGYPDVAVVYDHAGHRCHMVWIGITWIDALAHG